MLKLTSANQRNTLRDIMNNDYLILWHITDGTMAEY